MFLFFGFILGIIFIRYILPLLDQISALLQASLEHKRMKIGLKNVKLEKRIDEIVNTDDVPKVRQIGFVVDNPEDYNTEEEIPNDDQDL